MEGGKTRIYKQNLSRLIRLPDFFGITDSSGLMPLSRIWDNGMINNGKAPQLEDTPSMLGQLKEKAEACKDTPSPKKTKSKER